MEAEEANKFCAPHRTHPIKPARSLLHVNPIPRSLTAQVPLYWCPPHHTPHLMTPIDRRTLLAPCRVAGQICFVRGDDRGKYSRHAPSRLTYVTPCTCTCHMCMHMHMCNMCTCVIKCVYSCVLIQGQGRRRGKELTESLWGEYWDEKNEEERNAIKEILAAARAPQQDLGDHTQARDASQKRCLGGRIDFVSIRARDLAFMALGQTV